MHESIKHNNEPTWENRSQAHTSMYVNSQSQMGQEQTPLLHVLSELGDLKKAKPMALRAVMFGERHEAVYRKTLEKILGRRNPWPATAGCWVSRA
jgi:hypothetical protein